ncbi:uncharacterized protein J3D65DRAFT_659770 [Phyllosticta citribraziliensis]|uniref:Uncharacterized protein n=1 Tax=Phyllosticta citribraziliensis TaxID=989973 RepID=A0ABR1LIB5_9PEZI
MYPNPHSLPGLQDVRILPCPPSLQRAPNIYIRKPICETFGWCEHVGLDRKRRHSCSSIELLLSQSTAEPFSSNQAGGQRVNKCELPCCKGSQLLEPFVGSQAKPAWHNHRHIQRLEQRKAELAREIKEQPRPILPGPFGGRSIQKLWENDEDNAWDVGPSQPRGHELPPSPPGEHELPPQVPPWLPAWPGPSLGFSSGPQMNVEWIEKDKHHVPDICLAPSGHHVITPQVPREQPPRTGNTPPGRQIKVEGTENDQSNVSEFGQRPSREHEMTTQMPRSQLPPIDTIPRGPENNIVRIRKPIKPVIPLVPITPPRTDTIPPGPQTNVERTENDQANVSDVGQRPSREREITAQGPQINVERTPRPIRPVIPLVPITPPRSGTIPPGPQANVERTRNPITPVVPLVPITPRGRGLSSPGQSGPVPSNVRAMVANGNNCPPYVATGFGNPESAQPNVGNGRGRGIIGPPLAITEARPTTSVGSGRGNGEYNHLVQTENQRFNPHAPHFQYPGQQPPQFPPGQQPTYYDYQLLGDSQQHGPKPAMSNAWMGNRQLVGEILATQRPYFPRPILLPYAGVDYQQMYRQQLLTQFTNSAFSRTSPGDSQLGYYQPRRRRRARGRDKKMARREEQMGAADDGKDAYQRMSAQASGAGRGVMEGDGYAC